LSPPSVRLLSLIVRRGSGPTPVVCQQRIAGCFVMV